MKGVLSMRNKLLSALALALCCACPFLAQTTAGVNGNILDTSGASIPEAVVLVTNLDNGSQREMRTNESGVYQIPQLQAGRYSITARKQGFKQTTRDGLQLEVNQTAKIDFVLEPGAVSETIEVSAA